MASPYEPEAFLALVRAAAEEEGFGDRVAESDVEGGEVYLRPCDLLVTDPDRDGGAEPPVEAVWAAEVEVNPTPSFQGVSRPTTALTVEVARLADADEAAAAARRLRATRCPDGDFRLTMGTASALGGERGYRRCDARAADHGDGPPDRPGGRGRDDVPAR